MGKKTLILSEDQINELIGLGYGDSKEDDFADNGALQIFTGDHMDGEYAKPVTTDKISKRRANDIGHFWKVGGVFGNVVMRESTKKDWKKENLKEGEE